MRVLGAGDNVVDCYGEIGTAFPGGNAVNVAVAARRGGAESAYLGVVGTDAAGKLIVSSLDCEGVGRERLRVAEGPTARQQVDLIDGNRVFLELSVGVSPFRMTQDDLSYAGSFDIVHTGDLGFLEDQVPAIAVVSRVSFDFSRQRNEVYLERMLPHVTLAFFSGSDLDDETAARLAAYAACRGSDVAVVTRGRRDIVAHDGHSMLRCRAPRIDALDTLGAGDAFIGRFLAGYLRREPMYLILEASAQAAATTCRSHGAFGHGIPISSLDETLSAASESAPSDEDAEVIHTPVAARGSVTCESPAVEPRAAFPQRE